MANLIYSRVMALIDEQRLTRGKVEKAAGLGNGTIESWNSDDVDFKGPKIGTLEAVANVLGTSVEELVRKED